MNFKKLLLTGAAVVMLASFSLQGCSKAEDSSKDEDVKQEETQKDIEEETLSDTIRWFNASYAILTEINGRDYNIFAGLEPSFAIRTLQQKSLEESWSVTDRESADENLDWILDEGHRADFAADVTYLEECGFGELSNGERIAFMTEYFEMDLSTATYYTNTYAMYEQYGEHAIDAWDYCRALNLMSFYYLAGYYTEEEALDGSLEIAQLLQPMYDSWDELVDSYLRGYEYWSEGSSDARREIYDSLKSRSDNPYAVDYHTTLEKTW